jgi:hypothetical protein
VPNGRIITRESPRQVLGPNGRAYEPTGHLRDCVEQVSHDVHARARGPTPRFEPQIQRHQLRDHPAVAPSTGGREREGEGERERGGGRKSEREVRFSVH